MNVPVAIAATDTPTMVTGPGAARPLLRGATARPYRAGTVGGMSRLQEIAEGAATGSTAATYADIRRVTGVPFVVFIYRVLATQPGRLEGVWADIGPNVGSAAGRAALAEVVLAADRGAAGLAAGVAPLPAAALAARDLDGAAVAATLEGFRRANSANVVALWALLDGVAGEPAPTGPAPAAADMAPAGLPMADLSVLPATTLALLEEMSRTVAGGALPILIPSMWRTFAHDPELLALLWSALRPVLESASFPPAVAALSAHGRELAQRLPFRVRRLDDEAARVVVERFLRAIPSMLVTGALLETVLAELSGSARGGGSAHCGGCTHSA